MTFKAGHKPTIWTPERFVRLEQLYPRMGVACRVLLNSEFPDLPEVTASMVETKASKSAIMSTAKANARETPEEVAIRKASLAFAMAGQAAGLRLQTVG